MRFLLAIIIFVSCSTKDEPSPANSSQLQNAVESVDPPTNAVPSTMGTFTSYAHSLEGKAVIYTNNLSTRTLRLENYTMTQGPDVYVFISKTNNYSKANTIGVSVLKNSYSNSALQIDIDSSIDLNTYRFVLIYCVQYNALFGYAELK